MKTLIFTLLITLSFVFSQNIVASANTNESENPSIDHSEFNAISLNNFVVEEELTIEPWMTDNNYWNSPSGELSQIEEEESLVVEDWMMNHEKWDQKEVTPKSFTIWEDENGTLYVFKKRVVTEPTLQIEKWMTDYRYWN